MRKITTIVAAMLLSVATFAQVPQGFSYQAVVRDAQNAIVANQDVDVTITILQGATADAATAVFSEKHSAKTNANGLFTLTIGSVDAAKFAAINWAGGNLFLKTESKYGTATTQLLSVPFAMFAAQAGSANIDLSDYAKKTDIPAAPDLSNYALKSDIPTGANLSEYVKTTKLNDTLAVYALKKDVPVAPDLSIYALKTDIPTEVSLEGYATTAKLNDTLAYYTKTADVDTVLTKYATVQKLNDTLFFYAKKADIAATYATKAEIPVGANLSDYYKKNETDAAIEAVSDKLFPKEIDENGHDGVDLGLPSGTIWATCNVGAENPYDMGGEYAYGESEEKDTYTSANYVGSTDANASTTAYFGGDWVVPSTDQWLELKNNCYIVSTTNYNNTNKKGTIVYKAKNDNDKGKTSSPVAQYSSSSDTHIFLPYTGVGDSNGKHNVASQSLPNLSVYMAEESRYYVGVNGNNIATASASNATLLYNGRSVRPVHANPVAKLQSVASAQNAQNFGDMPLATVKFKIVGDGAGSRATVKFIGREWTINGANTYENTFKVPAYSPVYMTIQLPQDNGDYYYWFNFNGEYLFGFDMGAAHINNIGESKVNELFGPFDHSIENNITITVFSKTN